MATFDDIGAYVNHVLESPKSKLQESLQIDIDPTQKRHGFGTHRIKYTLLGREIGYAILDVDETKRNIKWLMFYPFLQDPMCDSRVDLQEQLGHNDIGTMIHIETMHAILDYEPSITSDYSVTHMSQSGDRKGHLHAMGLNYNAPINIIDYLKIINHYGESKGFRFKNIQFD